MDMAMEFLIGKASKPKNLAGTNRILKMVLRNKNMLKGTWQETTGLYIQVAFASFEFAFGFPCAFENIFFN